MTRRTASFKRQYDSETASEFKVKPLSNKNRSAKTENESTGGNAAMRPKRVCFRCRQAGHRVSECPQIDPSGAKKEKNLCYACGSIEHRLNQCPKKKSSKNGKVALEFADCFICNKKGHLASSCPQNTKGLYPDGGCCRFCGSTQHLARHCRPAEQEEGITVLGTMNLEHSADADDVFVAMRTMDEERKRKHANQPSESPIQQKKKVISFK